MTEEALRQAEESLAAMYRARLSAYDEGQRDALAAALTAIRALPKPWARAYMDTDVESAIQRLIKGDSDE
jgi:uncharacterized protein YllA (UPF0747 family)